MSAKLRLTAWFTLMMMLLCAATLTFVFVVNGAAVADDPQSQLIDRVDKNARGSKPSEVSRTLPMPMDGSSMRFHTMPSATGVATTGSSISACTRRRP